MMARDIDSPIVVPAHQIQPGQPVAVEYVGGGIGPVFQCTNTLIETKRGQLVSDVRPETAGIIATTGFIARYRSKVLGKAGGASTDTAEVDLLLTMAESGVGSATVEVRQAGHTTTFSFSSNIGLTWVSLPDLTIDDFGEHLTFQVEVTAASSMVRTTVHGVRIAYKRARATLPAGVYEDGDVPQEITQSSGEKPVSTRQLYALHKTHRVLFESRVGQLVSSSSVRVPIVADTLQGFDLEVPPGCSEARVWLYLVGGAGKIIITTPFETYDSSAGGSPALVPGWNLFDLDVIDTTNPLPSSTPRSVLMTIGGESVSIASISAYLRDATYTFKR